MADKQTKQIPTQFDPAESVKEIAEELIPKYHPHLANVRIAYLFKNKTIVKGGKAVTATSEKSSPKMRAMVDFFSWEKDLDDPQVSYDFIITVSYPTWNRITDKQKYAVIDHELEHCFVEEDDEGNPKLSIQPHDLEEFNNIVRRHGTYREEINLMQEAISSSSVLEDNKDEDEDE